jgi:hypothetical protein
MSTDSLNTQVALLKRDVSRLDRDIFEAPDSVAKTVQKLKTDVAVIKARIATYAAVGALVGGGVVSLVAKHLP